MAAASLLCAPASAQHLWWNLEGQRDATCLYGEITVLATHPAVYYCGANWHPGEPAGGYCGIQHNSTQERRTIFSIWDTSPQLHPRVDGMKCLTIARGDGMWGQLHGAYFLAEGNRAALDTVFSGLETQYGKPVFGEQGKQPNPIEAKPIPATVLAALKDLPRANKAKEP